MPKLEPRPQQQECRERTREQNTIVNMPTGVGKTLVAVLCIDDFRRKGKVIFIVPTRPLVSQQAEYVREHADEKIAVRGLSETVSFDRWREILANNDVLVGTAEIFRHAFVDTKALRPEEFSLFIFDECHGAVGNSPMASICRDVLHRCTENCPRILGLTASFVHGSLKDIEKKRRDLEGLMQATIFCPDVEERKTDFLQVNFSELKATPAVEDAVDRALAPFLQPLVTAKLPLEEQEKVSGRGVHVITELGVVGFKIYLRDCVLPQVRDLAKRESKTDILERLPDLDGPEGGGVKLPNLPRISNKFEKLITLIKELREQGAPKTIIFCEQTVLAVPLARALEDEVEGCRVGTATGVSSMKDPQREKVLEKFRSGEVPLLTCTAALEEGLDVSECQVVVRFSAVVTTKSHIQGAGRARKWGARVYYFGDDPELKVAKAKQLQSVAKDSSLSLTAEELEERRKHADLEGVHPFRTQTGAEINVFNCKKLVNEYAQRTMQQSFRPEENMLTYKEELVCRSPETTRKKPAELLMPSPDGFFTVMSADVDKWWGDVDISCLDDQDRMKRWTNNDRDLARLYYVAAVTLSKKGYLNDKNEPTDRAMRETAMKCPAWEMSPSAKIGVKYDMDNGPSTVRPASVVVDKGTLNEMMQRAGQAAPEYRVQELGPQVFSATVKLADGRTFQSSPCTSKKAAEHNAAAAAVATLDALERGETLPAPVAPPKPVQSNGAPAQPGDVPAAVGWEALPTAAAPALAGSGPAAGPSSGGGGGGSGSHQCATESAPSVPTAGASQAVPEEQPPLPAPPPPAGLPPEVGIGTEAPAATAADSFALVPAEPLAPPASLAANYKGLLQEREMGAGRGLPHYIAEPQCGGFQATVRLSNGQTFQGEVKPKKKDAEQSAAAAAWQALAQERPSPMPVGRVDAPVPAGRADDAARAPETSMVLAPAAGPAAPLAENYKGQLNEMVGKASYDTQPVAGGFVSTVTLSDGRRWSSSVAAPQKKEAEQQAARAAVAALTPPPAPSAPLEDFSTKVAQLAPQAGMAVCELLQHVGVQEWHTAKEQHRLEEQGVLRKVSAAPEFWVVVER